MKKKSFLLALVASAFFVSCGDKITDSPLTVEQHKENFVESGISVINEMDDMKNDPAIHAITDLVDLMDSESSMTMALNHSIQSTQFLDKKSAGLSLKAVNEEVIGFMADYETEKGVYTYNKLTGEFDKTIGNDIVYKFPIGASTTNNGVLSLTNVKYVRMTYNDFDSLIIEQPKSFDISLKNGTTVLMSFNFAAAYNVDGFPTLLTEKLTLGSYVVESKFTYSTATISAEQSFKHNGKNILSCSLSANGNLSYDNIVTDTEAELVSDQDMLSSANAMFAIGNYKLEGSVNWAGLKTSVAKIESLDDNSTLAQEAAYTKELATALNSHAKLYLKYYDNNQIIASNEYYAYLEQDYYDSYWELDMRMKFTDGSLMDESFFDSGIEDLTDSFDEMIIDFEESYSSVK